MAKGRKTGGRKKVQLNWDEVNKLISYQCTQEEVAAFFDITVDTLVRCVEDDFGLSISDFWSKKKAVGRLKLRKLQLALVERGGPGAATMAIWLDKKMNPDENPDKPVEPPPPQNQAPLNKVDFETFCENAGYPEPFEKQCEMREFAFDLYQNEPVLILGSRGYGKTDYLTALGVAYDVYLNPTTTSNLIITLSSIRNTAIMEEIENALLKNGVELEKSNAKVLRVKGLIGKDHSVEALTMKSSFRGRHPKRIIMDDPVTEEAVSEALRKLVKRKYNEAYKLCENMVIIGQPAHQFDLYADIEEGVRTLRVPYGSIPELDPDLEAMKIAGVDETSIQMSYHLKIPKDGASIFSNLKRVDKMPVGPTVAFIDPADGGDYTAITVGKQYLDGFAAWGKCYKKAWYHCLDDLAKVLKERGVKKLAFETNATGTQPIGQLRKAFAPLGIGVVGVHSTTNKHSTILAAGSYAHLIHLSRDSEKVYTEQVIRYEEGAKHDDAPDSLARMLEWLGLIRGRK